MPTAEITPQYVNAPKAGKKYGSIKTAEGLKFLAKTPVLSQFGPGIVAQVSYHNETWGQEQVQIIDSKIGGVAPPLLVPGPLAPSAPPVRARTAPADSKQIFVTALLKEGIAAGKVDVSKAAIVAAGNALKSAYDDLFGNPKIQTSQDEMNDEIPY